MSESRPVVRRSESEWRALYEEQESSGEPAAAFCRERGIAPTSYSKWRAKFSVESKYKSKPSKPFKEVHQFSLSESKSLEIELPNGVKLSFTY